MFDDDIREDLASILEKVAQDGLKNPRDLDVALDAIFSIIEAFMEKEKLKRHFDFG